MTEAEVRETVGQLLQLPIIEVADKELEAAHWVHNAWLGAFIAGEVDLSYMLITNF